MTDTALFIIGGIVSFLVVGGVLQANLYRALRAPDQETRPAPEEPSPEKPTQSSARTRDALTAWQTEQAIAAAKRRSDDVAQAQREIH